MPFKTIRSQIALYLSLLIFTGMFLIAMTALLSFQNIAAAYAIKDFSLRFETLANEFNYSMTYNPFTMNKNISWFNQKLKNSGACRIYVSDDGKNTKEFGLCDHGIENLSEIFAAALRSNRVESRFIISGFNLPFFSDTRKYVVISGPIFSGTGDKNGALSVIWDFNAAYPGFDRTEKLLFIYIIINTFVLVAVGVYQIGNITARPMKKILKKTESVYIDEFPVVKNSGSDFDHLSSSIGFLVDDLASSKKNLQYTVTELEAANTNMKKMQKEVIRAEKMASIGRLSAGLAHEIGNPVGIISGYLEMLKQEEIEETNRIDFASRANDELKRIDSIIRELLDYARPTDQVKTELSVHQLINDLVSVYTGSRAIGNIELKTDFKARFDSVNANHDQLRQVFMNLIINASDAICDSGNRNRGLLKISTANIIKTEGGCTEMTVSFVDNGCGLSENDLDNIFDPFFTTKPQGKGTGLGLSVSQMIIEDIGGSIKAYSLDGHGTEFRIILPLAKEGS